MEVRIYSLSDPRTKQPMYVGKTTRSLECRLYEHLHGKRRGDRFKWIKELRKLGLTPTIELLEIVYITEAKKAEDYWISKLGTKLNIERYLVIPGNRYYR